MNVLLTMPRVTTKGQVTIPKALREELGIQPGDEVRFERTASGLALEKVAPTTEDGDDPFDRYRGAAGEEGSMPDRMRRLRGEYPRTVPDDHDRESQDDERGEDA